MKKLIGILCILAILSGGTSGSGNISSKYKNDEKQKETLASVAADGIFNLEDIPTPYETLTDSQSYPVPYDDQAYNMDADCQNYYWKTLYSGFDIAETDSTIFFYSSIDSRSAWKNLKYINIFGVLDSQEMMGTYMNNRRR